MQKKGEAILVVGAGAAGIKASLDLAEMGFKVYLCDKNPNVGGALVMMDRWFPDNHCGMCQMLPAFSRDDKSQYCLRRGLIHPNVEILPMTEVEKVEGQAGAFTVTVKSVPSGVNQDLCIGCGICSDVCPIEVPDSFNEGLGKRKAIYLRSPWMPSNCYVIDWDACNKCNACVEKCPTKAIDLSTTGNSKKLSVGSVILSTGFEEFDPQGTAQYGHGRFPNVLTSIELERVLSLSGPSEGKLLRPSDQKVPKSVAFLQCVGSRESRDSKRSYCSYACCMYALKEAILIKKAHPETDVEIFYMDMRTFGKDYYRYLQQAKKMGVKFTRSRIPVVRQDFKSGDLLITAAGEDNSLNQRRFGMLILTVGQTASVHFKELADSLGVTLNENGFCETGEVTPVDTSKAGIYACGSAIGPKDIADSLIAASAAAGRASVFAAPQKQAEVCVATDEGEPKTAVFLCDCGEEISSVLDMPRLVEASKKLDSVVHVERGAYLCHGDALQKIKAAMDQHGANRLVLGTCAPFITRRLSQDIAVDPSLVQVVNLREEVAWPNRENPAAATEKALALLRMAVAKVRLQEPVYLPEVVANQSALVIGGGLAGMMAALTIADLGHEVHIIEREAELGGRAKNMHSTLEGSNVQALLKDTIEKVENNPLVHIYAGVQIVGLEGHAGNFKVKFAGKDGEKSVLEAGSIVVATGADDLKTTEYLYGQNEKVITQTELGEKLAGGDLSNVKSVAFIQCVGAMDEARPYCGRFCCAQALMNALKIKQMKPETEVVVFYRDLMSYGFMEKYYTLARDKGVLFVRYEPGSKPEVKADGGKVVLTAREPALRGKLKMEPDLVVLSTPVVPRDQDELAKILGVELNEDGFFKEAEIKFRPVDFLKDGIFVCGLAHSPRTLGESIMQAQAAGQKATAVLAKGKLMSGRMASEVNPKWCAGCEMCITVCPYGARIKDEKEGVVVVLDALCQGCGACVVSCPSGAASLRGFSDKQVLSMMDAAL